jgi:hypothetical protein
MALGGLARSGAAKDDMFQRVLDAFTAFRAQYNVPAA